MTYLTCAGCASCEGWGGHSYPSHPELDGTYGDRAANAALIVSNQPSTEPAQGGTE